MATTNSGHHLLSMPTGQLNSRSVTDVCLCLRSIMKCLVYQPSPVGMNAGSFFKCFAGDLFFPKPESRLKLTSVLAFWLYQWVDFFFSFLNQTYPLIQGKRAEAFGFMCGVTYNFPPRKNLRHCFRSSGKLLPLKTLDVISCRPAPHAPGPLGPPGQWSASTLVFCAPTSQPGISLASYKLSCFKGYSIEGLMS